MHQKRNLTCKDKEDAAERWQEGCNPDKIKSHTHQVSDPQTGAQYYQRSPPSVVKVLNPTPGFPAWGADKGTGYPQEI